MDPPDRDPYQLERQAITVATMAAGISPGQALKAIEASATLLRRASTLRNIALIRAAYEDVPDNDPGKIEVERVIVQLLAAIDSAQTCEVED